jgi:hypothetical protein
MSLNLTWPFVPATMGGVELLARRVEESQARGDLANFAMVQVGRRQKVKAEFFRDGFYVNLEFAGMGLNGLGLVSADVRANRRGKKRLFITLAKARHTGGRVGVAYDHDRGYMVAFNREGEAETIALPFSKSDIREIPEKAKQIHHLGSSTLATWAMVLLIALCRYDQVKLGETVKIVEELRQEAEGQYDDLMERYDLTPGSGFIKFQLQPETSHRG